MPDIQASFRQRLVAEMRLLRGLIGPDRMRGHVVVLTALGSTIAAIKLLHAVRRTSMPVQAVLHGYLNEIVGWRSRNPLIRAADLRSVLTHWHDEKLRYVVLEAAIARQLVDILPALGGVVDWVSLPFPSGEPREPQCSLRLPLRVGFLGLATDSKGFDLFLSVAAELKRNYGDRIEFHAIGRLPIGAPDREYAMLTTPPRRVGHTRKEYIRQVLRLHYVCLPYNGKHYELSASGVMVDAIAFLKPVIAMPTPVLREIFCEKPNIGYLCETPATVTATLMRLVEEMDDDRYQSQIVAMRSLRDERASDRLASRYREFTATLRQ